MNPDKKNFRDLNGKEKIQHIWYYYKFPLIILCFVLYVVIDMISGQLSQKNTVLYTALVNVTAGEEMMQDLSNHFLESRNIDTGKNDFYLYSGLYLTDDTKNTNYEYTSASRMKIMAAINSKHLDVVLMDEEAFEIFSREESLCNLDELLARENPDLRETLKPYLADDTCLDLSDSRFFSQTGAAETVYLGIIINSPRIDSALSYIQYLF